MSENKVTAHIATLSPTHGSFENGLEYNTQTKRADARGNSRVSFFWNSVLFSSPPPNRVLQETAPVQNYRSEYFL